MNDLELWHTLWNRTAPRLPGAPSSSPNEEAIRAALRRVSSAPSIRRAPFARFVPDLWASKDLQLRRAALDLVEGSSSVAAVRMAVEGLDDEHEDLRQRAFEVLHAAARVQPWRWVHALFHPREEIRERAIASLPHPDAARMLPWLRADPVHGGHQSIVGQGLPASLALELEARGLLGAEEVAQAFASEHPERLLALFMAGPRRGEKQARALIRRAKTAVASPGDVDILDRWCELWQRFANERRRMTEVLVALLGGLAKDDEGTRLRVRLAASCCRHLDLHAEAHDLARIAVACWPSLLTTHRLPLDARRAAARGLWELDRVLPELSFPQVRECLQADVAKNDDGAFDAPTVVGLGALLRQQPLSHLTSLVPLDPLIDGVAAHPECWGAAAAWAEGEGGLEALLAAVKDRHPAAGLGLIAGGLPRWIAREDTEPGATDVESTQDEASSSERLVKTLLDSRGAIEVILRLTRSPKPEVRDTYPRWLDLLEPRVHRRHLVELVSELLDSAEPSGFAGGVLARTLARRPADEMSTVVEGLGGAARWRLIEDVLDETHPLASLSATHQRAIARALARVGAASAGGPSQARAWVEEASGRARDAAEEGVSRLGLRQQLALTFAPDERLARVLSPALIRPTRGVTKALARRKLPREPVVEACVALLGSPVDPVRLAEQLGRYGDDDPRFEAELEDALRRHHGRAMGVGPLGHAWLSRDPLHLAAFSRWATQDKRSLADVLGVLDELKHGPSRARFADAIAAVVAQRVDEPDFDVSGWVTASGRTGILGRDTERSGLRRAVELLVAEPPVARMAARILSTIRRAGIALEELASLTQEVDARRPDMDGDAQAIVTGDWGFAPIAVRDPRARPWPLPSPPLVAERLRRRPGGFDAMCASPYPELVAEGIEGALAAVAEGEAMLVELLGDARAVPRVSDIARSLERWSNETALERARALFVDLRTPPFLRFRIGLGLAAHDGDASWLPKLYAIAREPLRDEGVQRKSWLDADDWDALVALARLALDGMERSEGEANLAVACGLAASPHPHAHRRAIVVLLEAPASEARTSALREAALTRGLELGDLELELARSVMHRSDWLGFPRVVQALIGSDDPARAVAALPERAQAIAVELLLDAVAILGVGSHEHCLRALRGVAWHVDTDDAWRRLVRETTDDELRRTIVEEVGPRLRNTLKLGQVADVFAWGMAKGLELTGSLYSVRMTHRKGDLGHTRAGERAIFVSPGPMLDEHRHGRDIVEGLILHEFGHHLYHHDDEALEVWTKARDEGLGSLLNLVADEHLERNLRALQASYGDRLKRLATFAFQHMARDVEVERILWMFGSAAFAALSARALDVADDPKCVRLRSGQVLAELDRVGHPLARFVRALRMGMGNRHGDPVLDRALDLFKGDFRHLDMKGLYRVTLRLSQIYGGAAELADVFGGHENLPFSDGSVEGIDDRDVQREIERIFEPPKRPEPSNSRAEVERPPNRLAINVGARADFDAIKKVEVLVPDPAEHRALAQDVRRHATRLRRDFELLGLGYVPRRARLQGRAFDRTRASAVVIKRDPRMLVARERVVSSDLFLGVAIDCSGSMAGERIDKARRFGVLLAETAKGMPQVDARFVGFTHDTIFDAGDERRCAVSQLRSTGGNNDAAGLEYVAKLALASGRRSKLLVMISDGLPTECSTTALRGLVDHLTKRHHMLCAQIAVARIAEPCFEHYIEVLQDDLDLSVRRFGEIVTTLARRALGG